MLVGVFVIVRCSFWLEIFRRHPKPRGKSPSQVLHIEIATYGHQARVIGGTLKRMRLVSEDSASHAIFGFPHNGKASSQRLTLASTSHLHIIFCGEVDHMVEIMSADMRLAFGMVFEAGRTA